MDQFCKDFMSDVPRGDSTRPLRHQKVPQGRWMELQEIIQSEKLSYEPRNPGRKILVGALDQALIGIDDPRHVLTVAGSRSGKSVGLIGNLLFYRGSVLAMDPKAELADITAEHRAAMGQKIYVLDPFLHGPDRIKKYRASYNPMSVLKIGSFTFQEDAALLAESMVIQPPDAKDPHWDDSARNFIEGVIIHVATFPNYKQRRNLVTVRDLINKAFWMPEVQEKKDSELPPRPAKPTLYTEMARNAERLANDPETSAIGNALMAAASSFYDKSREERSGVFSHVDRHTKFLDYPAFRDILQDSDFDLADLKRNPDGITIYLCFPAMRADLSKRWMRIFINQMLDAMEREETEPAVPILACLDEFPVLGYMKQIETAAGLIASFGVKLWVILQDWNQGKSLYGERWETFAANAGIIQFFSNNDLTTTEYISKKLGKTAVEVSRLSEVAQDQHIQGLSGRQDAIEQYDLLTPDEVSRQFSKDDRLKRQLILYGGRHPIMLQRVEYFHERGPLARYINVKAFIRR